MVSSNGNQQLDDFKRQQAALVGLMRRQQEMLETLEMGTLSEMLDKLGTHVEEDSFKVLVLGEFKRGKSTVINAMLGQKVLPSYSWPCTAIINEVKWGERPKALLYSKNHENGEVPSPQEIPVDKLKDYVVIKDEDEKEKEIRESPYDKVELFWPLELCKQGVDIIDSPGLNESPVRTKVTSDYLPRADAVLFVVLATAALSATELSVVGNELVGMGHKDNVFFVFNRINEVDIEEQDELKDKLRSKLSGYTKYPSERVFFVDAKGALQGRLDEDTIRIDHAGMLALETTLKDFLAKEKGRLKTLRTAEAFRKTVLEEVRRELPRRIKSLQTELETFERRYERTQKPLRDLEIQRRGIVDRIDVVRGDARKRVSDEVEDFYRTIADKVEGWLADYNVEASFGIVDLFSKKRRNEVSERMAEEIGKHIQGKVQGEIERWQENTLQPLLKEITDGLRDDLVTRLNGFFSTLDAIYEELATGDASDETFVDDHVSSSDRILKAMDADVVVGDGPTLVSGLFQTGDSARYVLPQIAIAAGTLLLATVTLVAIIPGLFVALFKSESFKEGKKDKVKQELGREYAKLYQTNAPKAARDVSDDLNNKFEELKRAIDLGLDNQIHRVREQAQSIIRDKREGKEKERIRQLQAAQEQVDNIDAELGDLIGAVAIT